MQKLKSASLLSGYRNTPAASDVADPCCALRPSCAPNPKGVLALDVLMQVDGAPGARGRAAPAKDHGRIGPRTFRDAQFR
jgi:hypothetical protein